MASCAVCHIGEAKRLISATIKDVEIHRIPPSHLDPSAEWPRYWQFSAGVRKVGPHFVESREGPVQPCEPPDMPPGAVGEGYAPADFVGRPTGMAAGHRPAAETQPVAADVVMEPAGTVGGGHAPADGAPPAHDVAMTMSEESIAS